MKSETGGQKWRQRQADRNGGRDRQKMETETARQKRRQRKRDTETVINRQKLRQRLGETQGGG